MCSVVCCLWENLPSIFFTKYWDAEANECILQWPMSLIFMEWWRLPSDFWTSVFSESRSHSSYNIAFLGDARIRFCCNFRIFYCVFIVETGLFVVRDLQVLAVRWFSTNLLRATTPVNNQYEEPSASVKAGLSSPNIIIHDHTLRDMSL